MTIRHDSAAVPEATQRSVLGQTGCEFEFVVLDGRTADGPAEIIGRDETRLATWRGTPDDAMNAALDLVRGDWVLFIDAGETFSSADALRRMFAQVPGDADVVYGHHIVRQADGSEALRHAADFATTSARLSSGDLDWDWLAGIPAGSATAFRREFLLGQRLNPRHRSAAGLDLMLRALTAGARLFNCDEVISIRDGPALDRQDLSGVDAAAVERLCAQGGGDNGDAAATTALARLGRTALRVVTMLDRHAPALARAVERIARGEAARRVARRLASAGD